MARILVADDNPLSLEFFIAAISRCGHIADEACDGMRACLLASTHRYDLMIIDSRMPLRSGMETLRIIRAATGPSRDSTAIATSADTGLDPAALLESGFSILVHKPIPLGELRALVNSHLPVSARCMEILDDEGALLKTGGDPGILASLRKLFANELDGLPGEMHDYATSHDVQALRDRLHKLEASAGFCGASRLASATQRLRCALEDCDEWPSATIRDFLRASAETRARLG